MPPSSSSVGVGIGIYIQMANNITVQRISNGYFKVLMFISLLSLNSLINLKKNDEF